MTTAVLRAGMLLQRTIQRELRAHIRSCSSRFAKKDFEEIKFNVPWGHISGKWYGPKNIRPIVGLHGWQDNAGTFDTLAPLLPPHVSFLSIDLPGHGLSSWLPDGVTYHSIDYVTSILTIMREFNWDRVSLMCHSMSSINGFVFCSLFPDKCDMFIALDILKPLIRPKDNLIEFLTERLETFHEVDERNRSKKEPPCYDYDELIEKLYKGTSESIEKETCSFILNRNIKPSIHLPHKYYFSRDSRLKKSIFYSLEQEVLVEMAQRITCPHLFIKALRAPYYENKAHYDEVLSLLKQKKTFQFYEVDGTHHVHLNEPNKVADIINPFINKHRPE